MVGGRKIDSGTEAMKIPKNLLSTRALHKQDQNNMSYLDALMKLKTEKYDQDQSKTKIKIERPS